MQNDSYTTRSTMRLKIHNHNGCNDFELHTTLPTNTQTVLLHFAHSVGEEPENNLSASILLLIKTKQLNGFIELQNLVWVLRSTGVSRTTFLRHLKQIDNVT